MFSYLLKHRVVFKVRSCQKNPLLNVGAALSYRARLAFSYFSLYTNAPVSTNTRTCASGGPAAWFARVSPPWSASEGYPPCSGSWPCSARSRFRAISEVQNPHRLAFMRGCWYLVYSLAILVSGAATAMGIGWLINKVIHLFGG